jgi:N-hydroxyarylamine O-acetyltransferase
MQLEMYLDRIGYSGSRSATLETLCAVQAAHLSAIPYENLDIHLGRSLGLGAAAAYQKIVLERRGGWCYEMNALLGWALERIGFKVTLLSSGVLRPGGVTPDGDHLLLCVTLEGIEYMVDAGFGDGAIEPLPITEGTFQRGFLEYRMERDGRHWIMRSPASSNTAGFRFQNEPRAMTDFAERCVYLQSNPESGFVRTTVCQRITSDALYTLRGAVLTTLTAAGSTQRTLETVTDYKATLLETFKLELPEVDALWGKVWARHLEWRGT